MVVLLAPQVPIARLLARRHMMGLLTLSWILPQEYEYRDRFERQLQAGKDEAHRILMDSGLANQVVFTNCIIPLQIHVILPTGEMCYARNSRVGGDVTMWVFQEDSDLSKGWPPVLFEAEKVSDATDYVILAKEMVVLINQYLDWKQKADNKHCVG